MKQHFCMFAAYNKWANALIYEASQEVDDEALWRDAGVFFGSLGGTLNHLLVTDRIWMARFTGQGDAPRSLDAVLHRDFDALRAARIAEDDRIVAWIDSLEASAFSGRFTYLTVSDMRTISQRLAPALSHFFNHQTHHRGHAHAALTRLDRKPPSLDLIAFQRMEAGRSFA